MVLNGAFTKGYKQVPDKCLAEVGNCHTHYPYKYELDKKYV